MTDQDQMELWPSELVDRLPWRRIRSSFIRGIAYAPLAEGLRDGDGRGWIFIRIAEMTYTYLAPAWIFGLLCSLDARGLSVGRGYSKWLKGRYPALRGI